jgi:hypothetical protein
MKNLFCFIFICQLSIANGQFTEPKFGKIEMLDFTMTRYDKDTTADALVLFDNGFSKFVLNSERKFQFEYTRHCRIKIFKKSAFHVADRRIQLYEDGSNKEKLSDLKAATYNLIDGKIVKTKLNSDNIYNEEWKSFIVKKFAFPEVKEGSIIEFSYTITSDFLYNFRGWIFQYNYPALWSQYKYITPEYFMYRKSTKGYLPFDVNINETGNETYTIHYDAEITAGINGGRTPAENYDMKAITTETTLAVKDVPAFKTEPNIDCEDNYIQSIEFELSSVQYPHDIRKDYTHSWESVNEEMNNDVDFGKLLNSKGFIADTVTNLCKNLTTKIEKAQSIYAYVQNRMKWNGDHRLWASRGLKKPFNERKGNSSETNLLLTLMLQTAGLNANPVMFSTRDNGTAVTFYPTISKYNSVLTSVEIDGTVYLLDATDNYCPFGVLPTNDINGQGRVVNHSNGDWVDLSTNEKYKLAKYYTLEINADGKFSGSLIGIHGGYAGVEFRESLNHEKNTDEYIRKLQENLKGLTVNSYSISDRYNIYKQIVDTMHVDITDRTELIGDKILFYPLLFERIEKNKYTLEEREYPVDYNYPILETYVFDYTIPAGYQVESVPKSITMKMPDNSITISYSCQVIDNKIKLLYRRNINKILFLPNEYLNLKEIYNQIVKKHNEQIILKKVI